ncbi:MULTISPECIES: hypothetical protein [Burkholderia]|jgi:hypothetical protein|uniref:hypothetical protein n=1 Tax=Burkholderia TaxID=32008 RepID=UPI0004F84EE9|nr:MULTISPECIES: hypothetical protein [Burkholderia]AIO48421.1 hypothetical protein DM42_1622 [Burkholderia cepacia]ALV57160.1 hypothetical protein TQ36_13205 [Burkholderia cenocepacia]AMU16314.1 hypothetical protein A3203_25995 [Burkholderia cenocepacia]AQQ48233.1 hypothetical protein A8F32_20395 [Burkholderia cenocepacia]ELW9528156.1 hypothetical protein [Burkholderia cenocepacia]
MNRYAEPTPHDVALRAAIAAAADTLRGDPASGSAARQPALGPFVSALADRLALGFPQSAAALHALVAPPACAGGPARHAQPEPQQ